ncbi:very short patch repair endonuclease [soil metagenome]
MKKKVYLRDKRSPIPKNEVVSKVMSANKAANTKPEIKLRKELWACGLRGYRCNYKSLTGRPDIIFPKHKLAIFVHGCFWHRCPHCNLSLPKNNSDFWALKFKKNKDRDLKKEDFLMQLGWKVFVCCECQVNDNKNFLIKKIKSNLTL